MGLRGGKGGVQQVLSPHTPGIHLPPVGGMERSASASLQSPRPLPLLSLSRGQDPPPPCSPPPCSQVVRPHRPTH